MNHYEKVLLDKMVGLARDFRTARDMNNPNADMYADEVMLLLDCIVDFREPPKSLAVEGGYGMMAVSEE